jgi:hypothetical protein
MTQKLHREIRYELQQSGRVSVAASQLIALPWNRRDPWDPIAAAKYIADVFHGLENLCKRRRVYLEQPLPDGPDSHSRILVDFLAEPSLGGRLSLETRARLKLYKDFRHRFIHGYGFEPTWEMVEEPLRLIPEMVDALTVICEEWLAQLPDDLDS